ncbi:hypothetical protein DSM106972_099350 [Dulcicalothrix desertica PCC 7102]|uniref:Smf/DprA SLOG domain-containing protein n=1 Tax=Dulcicalothrix desertica PCC 7102 TaxID=232991 RepID=A0A433UEX4_9CYAN|nr:hypothetical protein [Dulcicalothrix desertica]RUS92361.1 hypothetical protein DSM106972_099350 [Dulcicalothrix desertica PCC 7102]
MFLYNPERSIAVIGTRQPRERGRDTGLRIAQRFAQHKLTFVSGLLNDELAI